MKAILQQSRENSQARKLTKLQEENAHTIQKYLKGIYSLRKAIRELDQGEQIPRKLKEVAQVVSILHQKKDPRLQAVLNAALNKEKFLIKLNFLLKSLRRVGLHLASDLKPLLINSLTVVRAAQGLKLD